MTGGVPVDGDHDEALDDPLSTALEPVLLSRTELERILGPADDVRQVDEGGG